MPSIEPVDRVEVLVIVDNLTASLSISDTIEVRTISSETPDGNFVEIINPSAARVAYGTFSS